MNYRPKDWKNPCDLYMAGMVVGPNERAEDYEAGADAMLEALSKQNVPLPDVIHHYTIGKLGKMVFIPDEE